MNRKERADQARKKRSAALGIAQGRARLKALLLDEIIRVSWQIAGLEMQREAMQERLDAISEQSGYKSGYKTRRAPNKKSEASKT